MSIIPIELPLKASEAASLADLVFQQLEGRALNDDQRGRLSARSANLGLTSITPFWGSLQQDPVHNTTFYLAVTGHHNGEDTSLLLRMGLASSPSSGIFPKSMLIGRMRPGGGREVVVNAIPFSRDDSVAIRAFAQQVDRAFLPRPLGAHSAATVVTENPEPAFEAFRAVYKETGISTASLRIDRVDAAIWSAIRAGWRDGYSASIRITAGSLDAARIAIHDAVLYSRFSFDVSAFAAPPSDETWLFDEFARPMMIADHAYCFDEKAIRYLAARHAPMLSVQQDLYDFIRREKISAGLGRSFDFELELQTAEPEDLIFCMQYMKSNGRPVQLVHLPTSDERAATIVRHFNASLASYRG